MVAGSEQHGRARQAADPRPPADAFFARIECGGLSAFDQVSWIVLCAGLRHAAASSHVIEVSADGLAPACRDVLNSALLASRFPGTTFRVSTARREPDPETDFVVVSGSEVLTGQLLSRFSRVFVQPSAAPGGVDTALYFRERAEGRCFAALSKIVEEGFLPGAEAALDAFRRRFAPSARKVTLLTSVYQGDAFLDGFLENAAALCDYAEHEHFLVRAASPGSEHEKLLAHARSHPSAVYINLAKDPGLYDVWNLATCLASGRYLTSANIDDRRSPEHLARLARVLETHAEVDVASSALRVARVPNTPWETSGRCKTWYDTDAHPKGEYSWQALFRITPEGKIASRNMPHCMPAWRRALHGSHGFFRERAFGPSADWEFWLRCGTRGARLYLLPEALGLYLKREDSYWNVAAEGGDFDAKIIGTYHPQHLADETQRAKGEVAAGSDELPMMASGYARFAYFHRLVQLAADTAALGIDADRIDADAFARYGIANLRAVIARMTRMRAPVSDRTTFDCAAGFLAGLEPGTLDERRLDNWRLALADYGAMSGRLDEAMLAVARLYWLEGERIAAWRLMKDAYRRRRERFWPVFQALFRFALPLDEVTARLAAGDFVVPPPTDDARSINLWYYPDFRNNAYQASLYEPLKAGGAIVRAIDRNARIDIDPADTAAINILHIHWIHTIFTRPGAGKPADAVREFLAEVERAKARGVRVLWTVHNYLSHQGRHREIELALRRDLAGLVDDVYLHHPMIRDALDWLPEDVVPKLIEHGSYALANDWKAQRLETRAKLGLPESAKVIVCAGQLRPYKQLEAWLPRLLDWAARTPDARLLVLGQIGSDDLRELLSSANRERVLVVDRFLPESELDEYLCAADFGFLSYAAILTSGTMFHMLSRALPVIAPNKGTIPAYVVDGWNGCLYEDAASMESALDELDRLDEKAIERLHENALRVAAKLRWEFRLGDEPATRKRLSALERENAELAARLRRVLSSRTWKMTAPARFIGRWLRKLLAGRRAAR